MAARGIFRFSTIVHGIGLEANLLLDRVAHGFDHVMSVWRVVALFLAEHVVIEYERLETVDGVARLLGRCLVPRPLLAHHLVQLPCSQN